jgi:hypothetical protein
MTGQIVKQLMDRNVSLVMGTIEVVTRTIPYVFTIGIVGHGYFVSNGVGYPR